MKNVIMMVNDGSEMTKRVNERKKTTGTRVVKQNWCVFRTILSTYIGNIDLMSTANI